jgi:UDPglucose 6-dehydrogenase
MTQISYWYKDNIVVLKSTVPPGTCEKIKKIHSNLRIVFSPEFLTEANYIEDFRDCNRMIFGGESEDTGECVKVLSSVFPEKSYLITDLKTAETVKYFINTFLAVKVIFANEMKDICDATNVDYDAVKRLALFDNRLGNSHFQVPGPDGSRGFGGTCFPKDINALIKFSESVGVESDLLKTAWDKNLKIRNNKDWLDMPGRAISQINGDDNGNY